MLKNLNKKKDIRCGQCNKKLGEGVYVVLSIKCPRCKAINNIRAESPQPERLAPPILGGDERPGKTGQHGQQTTQESHHR